MYISILPLEIYPIDQIVVKISGKLFITSLLYIEGDFFAIKLTKKDQDF